jgi:hypothetical protein
MRACFKQLMFIVALGAVFGFTRVIEAQSLKTNELRLAKSGTLQVVTPPDWTAKYVGMNQPDQEPMFDLHAPSNTLVIRLYVRWDGFGGKSVKPDEAEMGTIVSNSVVKQYMPIAVEKHFDLEKLHGPAVTGIFARVTDSKWTPMLEDDYRNICEGMFRCGNIWGNFNLLTNDKDGPGFKAGLKVLESLSRKR